MLKGNQFFFRSCNIIYSDFTLNWRYIFRWHWNTKRLATVLFVRNLSTGMIRRKSIETRCPADVRTRSHVHRRRPAHSGAEIPRGFTCREYRRRCVRFWKLASRKVNILQDTKKSLPRDLVRRKLKIWIYTKNTLNASPHPTNNVFSRWLTRGYKTSQ